jgi:hypothetical protein
LTNEHYGLRVTIGTTLSGYATVGTAEAVGAGSRATVWTSRRHGFM